jgi:hypothetical protein
MTSTAWTIQIGGLVGANHNGGSIENSYSLRSINVEKNCDHVGGFVGINDTSASIVNSYSTGAIGCLERGFEVGGFAGRNLATIQNSYATGQVTVGGHTSSSYLEIGGFVGANKVQTQTGTLKNSFATGQVIKGSGLYYVGGLAGRSVSEQNSWWYNSFNLKGIGITFRVGNKASDFSDFYYMGTGTGKKVYTDALSPWDFEKVWEPVNGKYPVLRGVAGPQDK